MVSRGLFAKQDKGGNVNSTETRTVTLETGTNVTICRVLGTANTVYTQAANIEDNTLTGPCITISAENITYDCKTRARCWF